MSILIDRLIRSRRKTVALIIERDGKLLVRAPMRLAEYRIHAFVDSHADWIARTRLKLQTASPLASRHYVQGETFYYLGRSYPLHVVASQRPALKFDGAQFILSATALPRAQQVFTRWYKLQAARLLAERVNFLAQKHAFRYQKIRISSARTRWGSCSARNGLSFTYRLVMAPLASVDYVVLHELVHTHTKNHSKTFWKSLADLMPDYKPRLAWLKKNGKYLLD